MSDQDNLSAVPQKTLERLAKWQNEIAEIEKLIDQRRDEINRREDELVALSDKLFRAKDLRDEIKLTIEEYEETVWVQPPLLVPEVAPAPCPPVKEVVVLDPRPMVKEVVVLDRRGPLAVPMPPVGERVLKVLWRAGKPIAPKEIAETLGLNPQSVGRVLGNLKKKEFGDNDPATGLWAITPKGAKAVEATL